MMSAELPLLPIDTPEFSADPQPFLEAARAQHPWLARFTQGYVVRQPARSGQCKSNCRTARWRRYTMSAMSPSVTLVTAPQDAAAWDPFAELGRLMAQMELQHLTMMQRVAQRQAAASGAAQPGQVVIGGTMPAGSTYHYTVVSTSNSNGASCTQAIEWKSDGASSQPQVARANTGDCDAVKPNTRPVAAKVPHAEPAKPFDPRTI